MKIMSEITHFNSKILILKTTGFFIGTGFNFC